MRFEAFSFGSSLDRRRHGRDVVIDRGEVCKRKKRASKKFRDSFGHKPVSQVDFSRPGKPTDNPYVESFNGTFPSRVPERALVEHRGLAAGI